MRFSIKASKRLKKSIKLVKGELKLFKERKISDALKLASKTKPVKFAKK
jgi:hypothetical protein